MAGLEHIVALEVLPVHGVLRALDALSRGAVAVDGSHRLADSVCVAGAGDMADEGGHVHLVGTADGSVDPEPVFLSQYSNRRGG